jgi:hypothetical protein
MNHNHKKDEDWRYKQKESFANPHPEIQISINEKIFTRTFGKRCPICHDIFYTYQVEGEEKEPYRIDPDIILQGPAGFSTTEIGARETCGHPHCWEAEEDYQFRRRLQWRKEHLVGSPGAPAPKKDGGKLRD